MKDREQFVKWVGASVLLHIVLFSALLVFPALTLGGDTSWGSPSSVESGMNVRMVGSLSGIPLPSPAVTREEAAGNDSPGLHKSEPQPKPEPPLTAEPIPEPKAPVRVTPPPRPLPPRPAAPAKTATAPPDPQPANEIPFGQGGRPSVSYGQFKMGDGTGGIGFGDGIFGQQYGYYVQAITQRISQNWLKSVVDSRVLRPPRVYVYFEVRRDGTIEAVEIRQPSGIPSLDRSALRAVYASSPLPPLPSGYSGQRVSVIFWFEFGR